jgi:hypothetical protein
MIPKADALVQTPARASTVTMIEPEIPEEIEEIVSFQLAASTQPTEALFTDT